MIARQPAVAERWQQHVLGSSFGTIHAATFSFPRPLGAHIPEPGSFRLASLDAQSPMATGSFVAVPLGNPVPAPRVLDYPGVDRTLKGDRLVVRPNSEVRTAADVQHDARSDWLPLAWVLLVHRDGDAGDANRAGSPPDDRSPDFDMPGDDPVREKERRRTVSAGRTARLYFDVDALGPQHGEIERWAPGEEPVLMARAPVDVDIKRSAPLRPILPPNRTGSRRLARALPRRAR